MKRTMYRILAALCLSALLIGSASGEVVNRIAAVVDDQVITLFEVQRASAPIVQAFANSPEGKKLDEVELRARIAQIKQKVLTEMIEQKLLEAEVKRLGIPVSDTEIDEYVDRIKRANRLSDDQLTASLAAEGTTMAKFREQIKLQILREQYVAYRLKNKIEITQEEARSYYKQNQEDFVAEPVISLSEIRVAIPPDATEADVDAARQEATAIYEKLLAGADFAATAKKQSSGPTASSGGALGTWKFNTELAPDYRKTAEGMTTGQVAPPYRDAKGFVLLRCDGWERTGYLPFEDVADKIRNHLNREAAAREMKKLSKELYKKSFVDIKINSF